ncbi:exodeoxyribonuclease VIII [Enterobacter sp. CGMCC 5087]|uniref:exodeoxyribonuclease VIII n=1 Tax=Enterobacter sp. CGMCC 5087 TaxID=2183878 RepID=UPI000D673E1F|nr:exodeoxyribonuclease VIII [Enterobacter sp. CGMCC 5087]PWI80300.1 exodeoxyribonuclease VIII [Enterobacter sp. CGMCC 5087]
MSVELKVFGGACFPKDKALKKTPDLKPLVIAIKSTTKAIAEAVIFGKLAGEHPEHLDDYFKVKIWEHREELPCPEFDVFTPDFFDTIAVWNENAGEPALKPETDGNTQQDNENIQVELKAVARLDQASRAACLALFGPVTEITAAQYGQVIDLINDDAGGCIRELAEALAKESRSLALAPERQEQMLEWVRENAKESAQWPDIKKLIARWIDAPADKRPQAASTSTSTSIKRTDTGSTLGGGNKTDRSPDMVHNLATLRIETAIGILSMYEEIDIYAIPNKFMTPAKAMAEAEQDTRFTAWWKQLRGTPGILDYSRAAIIALIKSAPEDIWLNPIKLREYINRELVESNHASPDQKTIDIACSPKTRHATKSSENDSPVQNKDDLPAVCPGRSAQLDKELGDAFSQKQQIDEQAGRALAAGRGEFVPGISDPADPKWVAEGVEPALNEREIAIKALVEAVLDGKTSFIDEKEAQQLITGTGQNSSHLSLMITMDIFALENGGEPEIIDDYDVQYLAWSALEEWSDNPETRLDNLTRILNEYRQVVVNKPEAVIIPPAATPELPVHALTYHQQLTIAALQGLCANPAHATSFDDIPDMAVQLAAGVIRLQEVQCER